MANPIRTGRDGICSLWNFISREQWKLSKRKSNAVTLPLSLSLSRLFSTLFSPSFAAPCSFHRRSRSVSLPLSFFPLLFVTSPVDIDLAIHRERCLYAYQWWKLQSNRSPSAKNTFSIRFDVSYYRAREKGEHLTTVHWVVAQPFNAAGLKLIF